MGCFAHNMIKKITSGLVCLGLGSLLVSCTTEDNTPVPYVASHPQDVKALQRSYQEDLRHKGILVVLMGETVRLVLLSDWCFEPQSANLKDSMRATLEEIAVYLRTYDIVTLEVAGYASSEEPHYANQALSTAQADKIAKTLARMGTKVRLVVAGGYDGQSPVTVAPTRLNHNQRVEISFQYYPRVASYE